MMGVRRQMVSSLALPRARMTSPPTSATYPSVPSWPAPALVELTESWVTAMRPMVAALADWLGYRGRLVRHRGQLPCQP